VKPVGKNKNRSHGEFIVSSMENTICINLKLKHMPSEVKMLEIFSGSTVRQLRLDIAKSRMFPMVKIKDDIKKIRREANMSILPELFRLTEEHEGL
jgi:hypothetical protein